MKGLRNIIMLLLGICTLFLMLSGFAVSAEENISASGRFGELNWKFSKDSGILTISGEGTMSAPSYTDYWYTYAPFVRNVVIESGAENIAGDILDNCRMLESVSIPDSVVLIDNSAFYLNEELTIKCNYGSYSESYAKENGIIIEYLDIIDCGTCGDDLTWVLDKNGVLKISGSGVMDDYYYTDENPWYLHDTAIKEVIIEDGVENIGRAAFYKYKSIQRVTLGANLKKIGYLAFYECSSLSEVNFTKGLELIDSSSFYSCTSLDSLTIPDSVKSIGSRAFYSCEALTELYLPDSLTYIGESAFSLCGNLNNIHLSASMTEIPKGLFAGCASLTEIKLHEGIERIGECAFANCYQLTDLRLPKTLKIIDNSAFYMSCIDKLVIPVSVDSIGTDAFAYSKIKQVWILHDMRIYSSSFDHSSAILYCFKDSETEKYAKEYQLKYSNIDPKITYAGLNLTLNSFEGVEDIYIAKGNYNNFDDVWNNLLFHATEKKFAGDSSWSYKVCEGGLYTVCVKYFGGRLICKTVYVKIDKPTFEENGLQLKVGNLTNVKLIRVAYGNYDTIGQISRAEGERSFTSRDVLKGCTEYTIQFRTQGLVTVAVCYNNGYIEYYKYNVIKKTPGFEQEGNEILFTSLDDMKVLRFTEGEYSSSREIKYAPDTINLRGKDLTANSLRFTLEKGTYTFCVQYDDESYNYYTVTVK